MATLSVYFELSAIGGDTAGALSIGQPGRTASLHWRPIDHRAKDDVARNQKRTAAAKICRAIVAIGEHEAARCWPTAVAANSTEDTISGRPPHCIVAATPC